MMNPVVHTSGPTAREYWHRMLSTGGSTSIPRWTQAPEPGVGEHLAPIPDDLLAALDGCAAAPLGTLLLAAHAAVLCTLSGEADVVTGYIPAAGTDALPCRLPAEARSWRQLVDRIRDAEHDLLAHAGFPLDELRAEPGLAGVGFEAEFDLLGGGEPSGGAVLRVALVELDGRPAVRVSYRRDALDAAAAARIAGYHLTALRLLVTDPDTDPRAHTLLSAQEIAFQIHGLAGPTRPLPDRRFHQLFEDRAARHPDRVAAVHHDHQLTYHQLNTRANQLAHALLAAGLPEEGVVAVATERNLNWLTAVLAIFKAGGAYLPIEPHLPADRIATTLRRADCQLVLTEPAATTTLDPALAALPHTRTLLFGDLYAAGHPQHNPDLPIPADRLAYIYFTSGSTGEPKGAMCEHAGMLNHLHAKIADLQIGEGAVIAQTAPQSFDISLWQLIAALLVGGHTHLIDQDTILDPARMVHTLARARIDTAQLVPSYLEVVLAHLAEHPHPLPELRCMSVTGEALKLELAQRWFTHLPQVMLVNAYGLTETSDDTNHEVMHTPPTGRAVPLGPPVQNVHVYVVDDHLNPVPLGAPGQIVFSGVCVGRGYINDPDRTAAAYQPDPHRPGQRLYHAGDYGRWRPDGKLEFLGRRDTQIKISGFRIEIGEIENTLLGVPDVRDAAVIVAGGEHSPHLVGFYTSDRPLPAALLRDRLGDALPHYMIPKAFHWQPSLPLTPNGKIDKTQLTMLAVELDTADTPDTPTDQAGTPTEQRLAAVWAKVLNVPVDQIGRQDHFFDRGGTSLSAVKVAIGLNREVSLTDITRNPVLADLAALIDGRTERQAGLLHPLSEGAGGGVALVCFPHAGGNAVNFQPLAAALRGSGIAVYAVELPGHDLAAPAAPFAPIGQVAEQVTEELVRRGLTTVLLWGHSAGTALAHAAARRLAERGVRVPRVFLAAQLPGDPAVRRAAAEELGWRDTAEIAAELRAGRAYPELAELDPQRAERLAAAYRHDCVGAHRYFVDALERPAPPRLTAPVTVVLATDDPSTAGRDPLAEWARLAERVEVHELAEGGHHFLRTRPDRAAQVVLRAVEPLPS